MLSGNVVAGIFNSRREKKSDKYWRWTDLHPFHNQRQKQSISGPQLMAATLAMAGDVQWEFAPGVTSEKIIGGQIHVG